MIDSFRLEIAIASPSFASLFAPTRALYIKCVKEFKEIRAMNNCYKPTIFNCMAKTLRKEQKTRLLLVKKYSIVSFGGSFDAEPPPAATLAGIIRQYFCGSGNEVGTGSGCCQDGRAPPHPTTSPPPTISRFTFPPTKSISSHL